MKITLEKIQRQTDLTATEALIKKTPTFSPVFFMSLDTAVSQSSSRAFLCYTACSLFFTFLSY